MDVFEKPVERLIKEFMKMPTVGPKTAQRLAFFVIKASKDEVNKLCTALSEVKEKIGTCAKCHNLSEGPLCRICASEKRDRKTICVVADFRDLAALERTGEYRGIYHVLGGLIAPIEGVGPDDIMVNDLIIRIKKEELQEIILAMSSTINGETTALYITRLLEPLGVKVSRLAYGLPAGATLEYADEITLSRALEGRRVLKEK
jgi:recombination protein RecR